MKIESDTKRQYADEEVRKNLPSGLKLVRTLRGHKEYIGRIAWSPDGRLLATPSMDATIRLWDAETGECQCPLEGHKTRVFCVAFDGTNRILASGGKDGTLMLWDVAETQLRQTIETHQGAIQSLAFDLNTGTLASGGDDSTVKLWDPVTGRLLNTFKGHTKSVYFITVDANAGIIASGSGDQTIKLWDMKKGELLQTLKGHGGSVFSVAFDQDGRILASGSGDKTVKLWDINSGLLLQTLEGHTDVVKAVAFLLKGRLLASKSNDSSIRLWDRTSGNCLSIISEPTYHWWAASMAYNPHTHNIATVASDPNVEERDRDNIVHILEFDDIELFSQEIGQSSHYINAKVLLVGDTGVGKTGLSLVLNKLPFEATDSTPGRRVWTFESLEVETADGDNQTRETLMWDLAGQPGYRIIHQLHLNEVAVAVVIFDARSETDPLAGVRHWDRALSLARQRQGDSAVPMVKFLVSARNDRGGISIGKERLKGILADYGFQGYFITSAKEGWNINELREAIKKTIKWGKLPKVSSSQLFTDIKLFLLQVKMTGLLLAPVNQLYHDFVNQNPRAATNVIDLEHQFETCIGRLENRDLIRRLSFGDYVLLQPELLDAYASAMVNMAKEEPDGLGSLAEEIALSGKFFVPGEQKIKDESQEQLLLNATVEELVIHDLAIRENSDDGRYLVFPSQFNRDYEDAPEPKGKALAITFEGPVQSLYTTLAVRLGHSGRLTTGRSKMWRNAVVFQASTGGLCGLYLQEFAEAHGRLILFFDKLATDEMRFHFEEFVLAHIKKRALEGSVKIIRFFVCNDCDEPVPDAYVQMLRERGAKIFRCPCGGEVSLAELKEKVRFKSGIEAMDRSATEQRDFDAFLISAKGETGTERFLEWAGGKLVTLSIVFTDIVNSTALGEEIGDEAMNDIRRVHFAQSRKLIRQFKGYEIKTIGDSFMAAFRSVGSALDYAIEFQEDTGHPRVQIRAGIHIGQTTVEQSDVFGRTVNFAARVIGAIKGAEIWVSERAKEDIDSLCAARHQGLIWERNEGVSMKGFSGTFTLWWLKKSNRDRLNDRK